MNSHSEYFADDVADFTANAFKWLGTDVRQELRYLLCNRGVYVPRGRGVFISYELHAIVQYDLPWPGNKNNEEMRDAAVKESQEQSEVVTPQIATRIEHRGTMVNMFEAYTRDEDGYSVATTDDFDRKFRLLVKHCNQVNIPRKIGIVHSQAFLSSTPVRSSLISFKGKTWI